MCADGIKKTGSPSVTGIEPPKPVNGHAVPDAGDVGSDLPKDPAKLLKEVIGGGALILDRRAYDEDPLIHWTWMAEVVGTPLFLRTVHGAVDRFFPAEGELDRSKLDALVAFIKSGSVAVDKHREVTGTVLTHLLTRDDNRLVVIEDVVAFTPAEYVLNELVRDVSRDGLNDSPDLLQHPPYRLLADTIAKTGENANNRIQALIDYSLDHDPNNLPILARLARELHRLYLFPTVVQKEDLVKIESTIQAVVYDDILGRLANGKIGSAEFDHALEMAKEARLMAAIPILGTLLKDKKMSAHVRRSIQNVLEVLGGSLGGLEGKQRALSALLADAFSRGDDKEVERIKKLMDECVEKFLFESERDKVNSHTAVVLPEIDSNIVMPPFAYGFRKMKPLYDDMAFLVEKAIHVEPVLDLRITGKKWKIKIDDKDTKLDVYHAYFNIGSEQSMLSFDQSVHALHVLTRYFYQKQEGAHLHGAYGKSRCVRHQSIQIWMNPQEYDEHKDEWAELVSHSGLGKVLVYGPDGKLLGRHVSNYVPVTRITVDLAGTEKEAMRSGRAVFDRLSRLTRQSFNTDLGTQHVEVSITGNSSSSHVYAFLDGMMKERDERLKPQPASSSLTRFLAGVSGACFGLLGGMLLTGDAIVVSALASIGGAFTWYQAGFRETKLPERVDIHVDNQPYAVLEQTGDGRKRATKARVLQSADSDVVKLLDDNLGKNGLTFAPDADRMGKDQEALGSGSKEDVSIDQGLPEDEPMITIAENFGTEFYRTETLGTAELVKDLAKLPGFSMLDPEVVEKLLTVTTTRERGVEQPVKREEPHGFFPKTDPWIPAAGLLLSALAWAVTKNPQLAAQASSLVLTPLPETPDQKVERYRRRLMNGSL